MFKENRPEIASHEPEERDDKPLQEFKGFDPDRRNFLKTTLAVGTLLAAGTLGELYRRGYFDEEKQTLQPGVPEKKNEEAEKIKKLLSELKKLEKDLQNESITQNYGKEDVKKFNILVEQEIQRVRDLHHNKPVLLDKLFKNVPNLLPDITRECQDLGVPLSVALGVVLEESRAAHGTVTPAGDMGIFQLQLETAKQWKEEMQKKGIFKETMLSQLTPNDPRVDMLTNLRMGLYGLKKLSHLLFDCDFGVFAFHNGVKGTFKHFDGAQKSKQGKRINYLDVFGQASKTAQGDTDKKKALYPVRVEAKLRLFKEYFLPRLISKLEKDTNNYAKVK